MAKKANTTKEETAAPRTKKIAPLGLEKLKVYSIEGIGGKHLKKGKVYKVSGDVAEILVKSGQAKLK